MQNTHEEWRAIIGHEGVYEVSNLGRVKSCARNSNQGHDLSSRVLTLRPDKKGYLIVRLFEGRKEVQKKVHRLVAEAFIPNPKQKPQVNHLNGDKADNRAENLEWCTNAENLTHAWKNGLQKMTLRRRSKIAAAKTGKTPSAQARLNMSKAQKGRIHSEETRRKISSANSGKNHYGWLGQISMFSLSGDFIMNFDTSKMATLWIREHTKYSKANPCAIWRAAKGEYQKMYGYKWQYKSKERYA